MLEPRKTGQIPVCTSDRIHKQRPLGGERVRARFRARLTSASLVHFKRSARQKLTFCRLNLSARRPLTPVPEAVSFLDLV